MTARHIAMFLVVGMMTSRPGCSGADAWSGSAVPSLGSMGIIATDFKGHTTVEESFLACTAKGPESARLAVTVSKSKPNIQNNWPINYGLLQFYMASYTTTWYRTGMGFALDPHGSQKQEDIVDIDVSLVLDVESSNAYLVLTEFAATPDLCTSHDIGTILDLRQGTGYAGAGTAGFSAEGYTPSGVRNVEPLGLVKILNTANSTVQNIKVGGYEGFKMSDLAGRGFAVCDSMSFNWDASSICDDPVFLCCGLTYSREPATLPP